MSALASRFHKLNDPHVRGELVELRALMIDCLARMDRLKLVDVAQHMDLAVVRFDERYPVGAFTRNADEEASAQSDCG